jgi:hypothetical protein
MAYPSETKLFSQISHPKKRAFLLAFAEIGQITRAARAASVDHSLHYYWHKTDPAYREAFADAKDLAAATLEEEAIRRARDGVKRTIFYQGEAIGEELTYSDTLLIFLLKGAIPDKYSDKHELTGKSGAPLPPLQIILTQESS